MILMILGLALWFMTHLVPIMKPQRRAALVDRFGEIPYKAVYAVVSLVAVVLMVNGYKSAGIITVWSPPAFMVHINNLLMVFALLLFFAGRLPSHLRWITSNPQLVAVKTWATAHLLVNGDLASIVLFGALIAWGVMAAIATKRRDGKRAERPVATVAGTAINVVLGLAVYGAVAWVHGALGVWPFAA